MTERRCHPYIEALVERVARAICQSRKFECGQGCCAPICMEALGDARAKCGHCVRVHGDLARAALSAVLDGIRDGDEQSLRLACGYSDFCMPDGFDQSSTGYLREMRSAWTRAIDNLRERNG